MSTTELESLRQRLDTLCADLGVRRLDAGDIVELLADGEDPAWVAEQAIEVAGDGRTRLQQVLTQLAELVYVPAAPDEEQGLAPADGGETSSVGGTLSGDAGLHVEDPPGAEDQMAQLREALPPGVDAAQLEQILSSPRGRLLADFGAFCQERGYEGQAAAEGMDDEMQALHDEWLQTPRATLEGKRPSQLLEGGRLFPEKVVTFRREEPKVGRNDPCPCGSGKKYKKCCGR